MSSSDFQRLFRQMIGGSEDEFFNHYWRQRVLLSKAAVSSPCGSYSCGEFVTDYKRANPLAESLIVTIDGEGVRRMVKPDSELSANGSLEDGGSLVLQAIMFPKDSTKIPTVWKCFVDLHYDLCAYLLPGLPPGSQPDGAIAAVDMFYTSGKTSTGGHYDTGDVFYFVLDGEKQWTLELTPDPETVLRLFTSKDNKYMHDHQPSREHITVTVQPGDCLYVPPFTYHRVSSNGPTLAISIGLPTYTEATLLKTVLTRLQTERLIWKPLPSFPLNRDTQFQEAQNETRNRVSQMLDAMAGSISPLTTNSYGSESRCDAVLEASPRS